MALQLKELLITDLKSEKIATDFCTMKSSLPLSAEDHVSLDTYFNYKCNSLIESMQDVCSDDDESEVHRLLPHVWIEYRMEWIRYNAQMQYQNVTQGQTKPLLMGIGAALSSLINLVEKYLPSDELYWCTKLAYDPIPYMSSRMQLTSRIVDIAGNIGVAGHQVIEQFIQVQESLRLQLLNSEFEDKMETVIEDIKNLLSASMALPADDLANSFEMILANSLKESPVQIVVNRDLSSDEVQIPAETVHGLNLLFESWLKQLIKNSIETSLEQRQLSGKTDHVQIQWKIVAGSSGRFAMIVNDDGCGTLNYTPDFNLPQDWRIEMENTIGKGSQLTINFKSSNIIPMIHFGVLNNDQPFHFIVPLSHVVQILEPTQVVVRNDILSLANVNGEVMSLIDLAVLLKFQHSAKPRPEIKAYVKVKTTLGTVFLIAVEEIYNQVRGTTRSGQSGTPFIEDYILLQGRLVPVINVDILKEVVDGKFSVSKLA